MVVIRRILPVRLPAMPIVTKGRFLPLLAFCLLMILGLMSLTHEQQAYKSAIIPWLKVCFTIVCACILSSGEHNLPDSPFASSTKSTAFSTATAATAIGSEGDFTTGSSCNIGGSAVGGANPLRPPTLDIPSPRTCFFPMPRYGHATTLSS